MKIKNAFTLAEILIALTIIGIILVLVLSSYLKGVHDVQYKTTYKKALNIVSNFIERERIEGSLTKTPTDIGRMKLFNDMIDSFVVKAYVPAAGDNALQVNSTIVASPSDFIATLPAGYSADYWVVTEDNISYFISKAPARDEECLDKLDIIHAQDADSTTDNSTSITIEQGVTNDPFAPEACYVIYVDVNGLSAGPNQVILNSATANSPIPMVEQDQFPVYVGKNGAVPGSYSRTVTGRMVSNLK